MPTHQASVYRQTGSIVLCLLLTACGHDFYKQRADMIRAHVEAFQTHLKANRIEAAIYENEEIEATASEVANAIRKRDQPLANGQVDHEWKLLKAAIDAAATNWLALGRRLTSNKQYDQARAAYQRVIDTYSGEAEQPYRERAARAKRDLDILNPPVPVSAPRL
ncbi:MAG TPA: hypothetical protein VKP13_04200 [Nitrospira sp.]|nr:hypothetical protein [Nitrospira sp.]